MANYKYTILIPQQAYETLGIQISLEAAVVMSFLQEVSSVTAYTRHNLVENKKTYFWFAHTDIIGNLPMVFATRVLPIDLIGEAKEKAEANIITSYKKRLRRVMSELIEIGLLESHPNNREKNQSFYCFTELSDALITSYKNVQGATEPRTKTYKVSDRPRTKTYKVEQPTSYKNVQESVNNNLPINKEESVNKAHTPEKILELQSEEKEKEKSCAKKEKPLPFQPIRTAVELKEVLIKIYTNNPAKLENVKDTFSVYKTNWTKSGMRAALTKFSNWYFSKPDSIPVFDENKADTLFLNALNWLCKEVKDYKDEQNTASINKTPQIEQKSAISKEYEYLILQFIEAKTNGKLKIASLSEIKPLTQAQRLMDMGIAGGIEAMQERVNNYKSIAA